VKILTFIVGALALAAWFSALFHSVRALSHLSGKNSLGQMMFHGIRFFDAENFTPRGRELQRRFVRSFVAFFGCLFALMAITAASK
jgi:hypothetical protein